MIDIEGLSYHPRTLGLLRFYMLGTTNRMAHERLGAILDNPSQPEPGLTFLKYEQRYNDGMICSFISLFALPVLGYVLDSPSLMVGTAGLFAAGNAFSQMYEARRPPVCVREWCDRNRIFPDLQAGGENPSLLEALVQK